MTNLQSWIPISKDSDFSIYNLPYGIFSRDGKPPQMGIAIGDQILDIAAIQELGIFKELAVNPDIFRKASLNDFIALGKKLTVPFRQKIQRELCNPSSVLKEHESVFVKRNMVNLHLPIQIGDYTDFYSSIEHATNVGKMFRNPVNALLPNWRHLPVGYHGRASSIVLSGTDVHRPKGQLMPKDADKPVFQASGRLDFELEMAFVIGKENALGKSISTEDAESHIFGLLLFNDWSARDIQKWEYVPLGPFLGKNFASSISPWIVPLEAFDPFRIHGPVQSPPVLSYLRYEGQKNYNIQLEVAIQPDKGSETVVCNSNFKYMYWNMCQQLAHHSINGCNVRVGDLLASGTISGKDENSYGSMLELSWAGTKPVRLNDGSYRKFIQDGDTVIMRGYAQKGDVKVGFGEVRTKILPAH